MSKQFKNLKQEFRHRGFQSSDDAANEVAIFGDGPVPVNADGSPMQLLWDHDVKQSTEVQDHVEAPPG